MIVPPKFNCLSQLEFELLPKGLFCPKVISLLTKCLDIVCYHSIVIINGINQEKISYTYLI